MATKSFNIGECAVGGIIKVDINGKIIIISALTIPTKTVVCSGSYQTDLDNSYWTITKFLNDLTTSYHAEKILNWVQSKCNL